MAEASRRNPSIVRGLLLGAWFPLVGGFLELALLHGKAAAFGSRTFVSSDALWMTPTAHLLFFAVPVVVAAIAWRLWPARASASRVAGALGFLESFGVLYLFPSIHRYARLVLALGIGVQAARIVGRREEGFLRLTARTTPALAALVILLGVGAQAWGTVAGRVATARLAAAAEGAPNVLLIILDTVRAGSLGLYGGRPETSPGLARLAERGVTFERAFSPSPWTLPAHATLFTGRYPHEHGADWEAPLGAEDRTLAEVLGERGYRTAGFVANLYYCTRETGIDRGFVHYDDYPVSLGQVVLSSVLGGRVSRSSGFRRLVGFYDDFNRKTAGEVSADFLEWLGPDGSDRPFFAFLNYFDAHEPYLPPDSHRTLFGPDTVRSLERIVHGGALGAGYLPFKNRLTPAEIQGELDAYEASIAYVDQEVDALLAELDARGLLENTLVVVTSDHGEQFGEHGAFDHGNTLYSQVLHVPLVVAHPRSVPPGVRVAEPVTLLDVPATVLDLVGGASAGELPGSSLAALWSGNPDDASRAPGSPVLASVSEGVRRSPYVDIHSIVQDGYHFIRYQDGRQRLYDIVTDIDEERDLADSPDHAELLERLGRALEERIPGSMEVVDRERAPSGGRR